MAYNSWEMESRISLFKGEFIFKFLKNTQNEVKFFMKTKLNPWAKLKVSEFKWRLFKI